MVRRSLTGLLLILRVGGWLLALGASACGPVGYLQQVHGKARNAVSQAKRAGAATAAPYEYTCAVEYLKKAEEEGDHSEYQVAIEYGHRAEEFAERARGLASKAGGSRDEAGSSPEGGAPEDQAPVSGEPAEARSRKGSP